METEKTPDWEQATRGRVPLDKIERLVRDPRDLDAAWATEAHRALSSLRDALAQHYHTEEEGQLYNNLPQLHAEFSARLFRLVAEHDTLLAFVTDLIGEPGPTHPAQCARMRLRIQLLLAKIRRHEAEEDEILLSAAWQDLEKTGR